MQAHQASASISHAVILLYLRILSVSLDLIRSEHDDAKVHGWFGQLVGKLISICASTGMCALPAANARDIEIYFCIQPFADQPELLPCRKSRN